MVVFSHRSTSTQTKNVVQSKYGFWYTKKSYINIQAQAQLFIYQRGSTIPFFQRIGSIVLHTQWTVNEKRKSYNILWVVLSTYLYRRPSKRQLCMIVKCLKQLWCRYGHWFTWARNTKLNSSLWLDNTLCLMLSLRQVNHMWKIVWLSHVLAGDSESGPTKKCVIINFTTAGNCMRSINFWVIWIILRIRWVWHFIVSHRL